MTERIRGTRIETHGDVGFDHDLFAKSLESAAKAIRDDPWQREILGMFVSGRIHKPLGGDNDTIHGNFVGPDGAIYQPFTDCNHMLQIRISPVDERNNWPRCRQPRTYDGFVGSFGGQLRLDFINKPHGVVPRNSIEEMNALRQQGRDPIAPLHVEGPVPPPNRDSLTLTKYPDGHVEVLLHDGQTGETTWLFPAHEVLAVIDELDKLDEYNQRLLDEAIRSVGARATRATIH